MALSADEMPGHPIVDFSIVEKSSKKCNVENPKSEAG
jgi:hypothetical protein